MRKVAHALRTVVFVAGRGLTARRQSVACACEDRRGSAEASLWAPKLLLKRRPTVAAGATKVQAERTARTTASMSHTMLSMPRSCVVALSLDAACSQGVSCSHYTQTAITKSTVGTQCSLTSLISAGSQTEAGFGVLEGNNTKVGDSDVSDNFTTSPDGADISAESSPHTSSCDRHAGNAGGSYGSCLQ
ncbi:uncharacterized protein LOC144158232 isoform X8 [Haemaphysalis longicornis]